MTLILFLPLPNKQIKYLYVMKKILFFMILLCPIVLGGCSSDDDDWMDLDSKHLVGTWFIFKRYIKDKERFRRWNLQEGRIKIGFPNV